MRVENQFNDMPASATFRLLSVLTGGIAGRGGKPCGTRIAAADRGSVFEAFFLSAMVGLAVLSVTGGLIMKLIGPWGLIALFPAWGVVLHVLVFACAGVAQLLCMAGLLRPARCPAFNGISFGCIVVAAALFQFRPGDPFSWFALPWLSFVAIECLLWPFFRLLDKEEETQ